MRGLKSGISMKALAVLLCVILALLGLAACGGGNSAEEDTSSAPASELTADLDQYYANENFMLEMLVNDFCVINEDGKNLTISTADGNAAIVVSIIPGIQNLSATGELVSAVVQNAFAGAEVSDIKDANLFGARAKSCDYQVADENGEVSLMGIEAAGIVNQTCYFLNVLMQPGMSQAEGDLIVNVFSSMNVLRPTQVDQTAKEAVYASQYQSQLDSKAVKTSTKSKAKPVNNWSSLPYAFYSWYGDPGDYGGYPAWYFEPDWDYYSDPGDYWDWGWDDGSDWWFYNEYGDYYDYDYYSNYDDYWADYDPWSDPGDTWDYGYGDMDSDYSDVYTDMDSDYSDVNTDMDTDYSDYSTDMDSDYSDYSTDMDSDYSDYSDPGDSGDYYDDGGGGDYYDDSGDW